jgi:osmotically-inducible protein OsmY
MDDLSIKRDVEEELQWEPSVNAADAHRRTDEEIARSVTEALAANVSVPADRVKAVVSQGWVMLEGTVEWY